MTSANRTPTVALSSVRAPNRVAVGQNLGHSAVLRGLVPSCRVPEKHRLTCANNTETPCAHAGPYHLIRTFNPLVVGSSPTGPTASELQLCTTVYVPSI